MQPTNRREVVLPRQIAVKVALEKAQMSGRRIGRQFPPAPRGKKLCHRDHTFALRCVQSLQDYIDTTPSIKEDIRLIERKVEIFSRYQMRAQLNNLKNRATA